MRDAVRHDRPYAVEADGVWRIEGDLETAGSRVRVCGPEGFVALAYDADGVLRHGELSAVEGHAARAAAALGRPEGHFSVVAVPAEPGPLAELNASIREPEAAAGLAARLAELASGARAPLGSGLEALAPGAPGFEAYAAVSRAAASLDFADEESPLTRTAVHRLRAMSDATRVDGVSAPPDAISWDGGGRFHGVAVARVELTRGTGPDAEVAFEDVAVSYEGVMGDAGPVMTAVAVDTAGHAEEHAAGRGAARAEAPRDPAREAAERIAAAASPENGAFRLWATRAEVAGDGSPTGAAVRGLTAAVRQPEYADRYEPTGRVVEGAEGLAMLAAGFGSGNRYRGVILDAAAAAAIAAAMTEAEAGTLGAALDERDLREAEHAANVRARRALRDGRDGRDGREGASRD